MQKFYYEIGIMPSYDPNDNYTLFIQTENKLNGTDIEMIRQVKDKNLLEDTDIQNATYIKPCSKTDYEQNKLHMANHNIELLIDKFVNEKANNLNCNCSYHSQETRKANCKQYNYDCTNCRKGWIAKTKELLKQKYTIEIEKNRITPNEMKQIILKNVPFTKLKKNNGIFEFHQQNDKSLGISYEDIDDETDVYIYNIFIDSEYINICHKGTQNNPLPNDVLNELVEEWNKY